jgi:hypothetical protein
MTTKKFNKKETIMKNKMIKHGIAVIGISMLASLSVTNCAHLLIGLMLEGGQKQRARQEQARQEEARQVEEARREERRAEETRRAEAEAVRQEAIRQGRLAQAQELSLGTEISKNLSAGEENWFSFQATGTGKVFVFTSGNIDTYLEAYDSNNREIARNDDGGEGLNARVEISVNAGITYLFKLRGASNSVNGSYRITVLDEAAERRRIEEANRYDPSKFTLVPSNFRPADYNARDLFNVVSLVEGIDLSSVIPNILLLDPFFVSDVVFVRQDGTDIWFRTDDNAITQSMKINSRSGLTAGQRVRLYYIVTKEQYRLPVWQVIAIERR